VLNFVRRLFGDTRKAGWDTRLLCRGKGWKKKKKKKSKKLNEKRLRKRTPGEKKGEPSMARETKKGPASPVRGERWSGQQPSGKKRRWVFGGGGARLSVIEGPRPQKKRELPGRRREKGWMEDGWHRARTLLRTSTKEEGDKGSLCQARTNIGGERKFTR